MAERLVIFGTSNAAGIYGNDAPEYITGDIVSAVFHQLPIVRREPKGWVIDLTTSPKISGGSFLVNAGMPGDSVVQMRERFKEDVLSEDPTHVFIWPGLNDAAVAMAMWRNDTRLMRDYPETVEAFSEAMKGHSNLDQALRATSNVVAGMVREMVDSLHTRGIQAFIGTIPPYSNRLAYCLELGNPIAKSQIEGSPLIEMVNEQLRQIGGERFTVDVHRAVVNTTSGLMKPEFSWGEQRQDQDTLHLSDNGQIMAGVSLASRFFNTPVRAITSNAGELRWE